jgi:hypothetical protein
VRRPFAPVNADDAMVVWLAVNKLAWPEAPSCFLSCKSLSLGGGDGCERKARVDDPIRPGVVPLKFVSTSQSDRADSWV